MPFIFLCICNKRPSVLPFRVSGLSSRTKRCSSVTPTKRIAVPSARTVIPDQALLFCHPDQGTKCRVEGSCTYFVNVKIVVHIHNMYKISPLALLGRNDNEPSAESSLLELCRGEEVIVKPQILRITKMTEEGSWSK